MKKIIALMFVCIFFFAGCGAGGTSDTELQSFRQDGDNSLEEKFKQNVRLPMESIENFYVDESFSITKRIYEDKEEGTDIEIYYPEIHGMEDVEKEDRINHRAKIKPPLEVVV